MNAPRRDLWRSAAAVVHAVGVGVLVLDPDGVVRSINPEATRLLGWTADHVVGLDVHDTMHSHLHSTTRSAACPLLEPAQTGQAAIEDTDVFVREDASLLPVAWTAAPMWAHTAGLAGAGLEPDGVVVTITDVTDRQARSVADAAAHEKDRADLWVAEQSVSDLGWIAELTRVMSTTLDEDAALLRLARLLTPRLADVVIVDRLDDNGDMHRLGAARAAHIDLDLDVILARPEVQHVGHGAAVTRATVHSQSVQRLTREQLADPAVFVPPSRALLAAVNAHSMLVVPLSARDHFVGVVGLVRQQPGSYSDADVLLAADIGRRAGLVLDNARLYRGQQRIATDLQRALLPEVTHATHLEAAARYLPAGDQLRVGGDWYDLFRCDDSDSNVVLAVGDVAGHDLGAATNMAALRNLLRGIAVTAQAGPRGTMTLVDHGMTTLAIRSTATVLLLAATRDDDGWSITYTNAGHPPALLVQPGDGEPDTLGERPEPPLGTRLTINRHEHTRRIAHGSSLLLYTDGLIEDRTQDIDVGLDRLRRAVASSDVDTRPDALLDRLTSQLPRSLDDDTAILAVRLN